MASERHLNVAERDHTLALPGDNPMHSSGSVQEQMGRILSDPLFHNSKRYSNLLRFIVEKTLAGEHDSLKERIIGIEVFGRAADYDTSLDASVRVAATEVRRRLFLYYNEPAHGNELRIDLPTRSYVAEFKSPEQQLPASEATASRAHFRRKLEWGVLAVAVLAVATWGAHRLLSPAPAIDRFWAPMLNYSGPIAISVGSGPSENPQSAKSGTASDPARPISLFDFIQRQTNFNFPITDLTASTAITSYLGRRGKQCIMRFAQTTTLTELRGQPLILLGSFRNAWEVRLGSDLRFRFKQVPGPPGSGLNWIEDAKNPSDRGWSVDMAAPNEQVTMEYALVTRALDQSTGQWWIGIAGITGSGTLAAQQMLLDPQAMTALNKRLPKDWDHKNLQIVLAIKVVQSSPGTPQVVATYTW